MATTAKANETKANGVATAAKPTPAEEARAVLQKEAEEATRACLAEIEGVLKKYGFVFDVSVTIGGAGGIVPNLRLVPASPPRV